MALGYIVWYRDLVVWCSFSAFHQCVSALAGGRLKAQHYLNFCLLLFTLFQLLVARFESDASKPFPLNLTERQKRVHEWKSKEWEIEGFATLQVRLSCLRQKYLMLLSDLCIFIHSPCLLDSLRNPRENFIYNFFFVQYKIMFYIFLQRKHLALHLHTAILKKKKKKIG